jgi:aminomethyltransferase
MTATTATPTLLRTPFYKFHVQHGAKLVDFAGWEMPLHYGSIIDEHRQVRNSGGFFDVSHMGRLRFAGRDARKFLDHVCTRQIFDMAPRTARYSLVCNSGGGCRDDVLVYRIDEAEFLMVCNASNRLKLIEHFNQVKAASGMVYKMTDETQSTAMVAVQGPKVIDMIANFSSEVPTLKRYRFTEKNLIFVKLLISRTGYTGEDGVEVVFGARFADEIVKMMLSKLGGSDSEDSPIKPAGLGARDSLRLEASMALYGHEITEAFDPLSAGLNFAIKLDKGDDNAEIGRFIGQDALQGIARKGLKRTLVGLRLDGKRSARQGMAVKRDGRAIGEITSGCLSPTLGYPIAMAYLDVDHMETGTAVQIDLGKTMVDAQVVAMPFYKSK